MSPSRPRLCEQRRNGRHVGRIDNVVDGHLEAIGVGGAVGSPRGFTGAPTVLALLALQYVPHTGDWRGVELLDRVERAARTDHASSHGIPFELAQRLAASYWSLVSHSPISG